VSCAKTAEPIEMPFGILSRVDPRNHVLEWGYRFPMGKDNFERKGAMACPDMLDDTLF